MVVNYFYYQQNEYFVSNYEFTDRSLPMVLKPSVKTKVSVVCKCACIVDCSGLLISIPLLGIYSISQDEATLDIFQELIPLRKCEIYRQKVEKKCVLMMLVLMFYNIKNMFLTLIMISLSYTGCNFHFRTSEKTKNIDMQVDPSPSLGYFYRFAYVGI